MKKILLIDDDVDFCFFLKANIEKSGDFQVTVCTNSTEAFKIAKKLQPDLVFIDIMMPEKSGIGIATDLRKDKSTRHIPYIFLSGIVNEREMRKYKGLIGDAPYVAKPVESEKIISLINEFAAKPNRKTAEVSLTKEKIRTVTFLTRRQIDFLDRLGKDALFYYGSKLSRSEILSELVNLLIEVNIEAKDSRLDQKNLSQIIIEKIQGKI